MGNCIRRKKSYWESTQKEKLVGGAKSREVKITISKKELEQLMQGLTLEQLLLARMLRGGEDIFVFQAEQPSPWKPVLQSIPEER
ncbi:hypothetical protein HRI_005199000 [Hibiscus trionum]|uniref:Uncharacterized protein n=1 Tax=Hibiscus trionum TaxID=183268 RepID=A0A9W7JLC6_HIBTR|nr:hypothetical protein HRI_005199000 [Hibiscus trionum]